MALGIGLFFVLASNRGWIDERARVALGAVASALVLGAGLVLRARFGQYWAALAAVGAGIAGAYATLAAAAVRYDLVPDGLALPLAGAIAMVGTLIAIRWRSQVIAAIGLTGAALAPALQALDVEVTWESVAFALIVLVAGAIVTVPRGWKELLLGLSAIVGGQVVWLVGETVAPANAGTVGVAGVLLVVLLGISVGLQLAARRSDLSRSRSRTPWFRLRSPSSSPGGCSTSARTVASLFWRSPQSGRSCSACLRGGAYSTWVCRRNVCAGARCRRDGVPPLDAALTIAWAAEAVVLAVLAARLRDARLQTMGIVYGRSLDPGARNRRRSGASLRRLCRPCVRSRTARSRSRCADRRGPLGACSPSRADGKRTARFLGELRRALSAHRRGLRESLVVAGVALATLAASFGLSRSPSSGVTSLRLLLRRSSARRYSAAPGRRARTASRPPGTSGSV